MKMKLVKKGKGKGVFEANSEYRVSKKQEEEEEERTAGWVLLVGVV